MALLNGIFNTSQNPAELNMRSFAATLLRLFPNGSAPLFALTSQLGKSTAKAATHGYFTKTMAFVKTTSTAGDLVGATTLTVGSTAGMVPGAVLRNARTTENIRVLTIVNPTSFTCTRAFGRVVAAALNAADIWNYPVSGITTSGSIGERLKNTATINSVSQQISDAFSSR